MLYLNEEKAQVFLCQVDPVTGKFVGCRWQSSSILIFQRLVEHLTIQRLQNTSVLTAHAKRKTLMAKDILAMRVIKQYMRGDFKMNTEL